MRKIELFAHETTQAANECRKISPSFILEQNLTTQPIESLPQISDSNCKRTMTSFQCLFWQNKMYYIVVLLHFIQNTRSVWVHGCSSSSDLALNRIDSAMFWKSFYSLYATCEDLCRYCRQSLYVKLSFLRHCLTQSNTNLHKYTLRFSSNKPIQQYLSSLSG